MHSNTKKIAKSQEQNPNQPQIADTLEDRLKDLAWNKIKSLSKKISNLKDITENLGNKNKRKQVLVDDKSFEEVKYKIDREYEKVFLKQMTKMKIIRQPRVVKKEKKDNYPTTNFYNQLIKDNSRIELSKKIHESKDPL